MTELQKESSGSIRQILFSSSIVAVIFLLVKFTGFIEKLVLANYFGTSDAADAYLMAFHIPFAFYLIIEEIINPVLVPYFVDKFSRGESELGIKVFKRFFLALSLIFLILSLGVYLNSEWFVSRLAPGFAGEKKLLTIQLLESMVLVFLFLGLSSLLTTLFHAHKQFNLPVLARALPKIFIVLGILLLHQKFGIMSAVLGCLAGTFLKTVLLFIKLPIRVQKVFSPVSISIPASEMRRLIWLMLPIFFGVLFSQASGLVDNFVSSKLGTGIIASLTYARKIVDLPVLIVPFSMGIVLLPYFSLLSSPEKHSEFAHLFDRCFKILLTLFTFITILVLVFNTEVVQILFERGKFDASSTKVTASALAWFSLGLIAFAIEIPVMQSFFALKDTLTPIVIGIVCALINMVLTFAFVTEVGFIIVPIALALQKTLKVTILLGLLKRKIPITTMNYAKFSGKLILNATFTTLILFQLKEWGPTSHPLNLFLLGTTLIGGTILTFVLFFIFSKLLRIHEINYFHPKFVVMFVKQKMRSI